MTHGTEIVDNNAESFTLCALTFLLGKGAVGLPNVWRSKHKKARRVICFVFISGRERRNVCADVVKIKI